MREEYQYNIETLVKLQRTELGMLKIFDEVCQKYGIEYFVGFGTAIGAVRHRGFIPWDDDIDVCMMRDEYEKLRAVPEEEWHGLILSDPRDHCKTHTLIYPQIYKPGTIFETEYHYIYDNFGETDGSMHHPIWLDIFLFDRVDSVKQINKIKKKAFFLQKMFYYSKSKIKVIDTDPLRQKCICILKSIIHDILNIWRSPEIKIYQIYRKLVGEKSGAYITSFDVERIEQMVTCCSKYEDVFPTVRVPFEDMEVCIQKNFHEALKTQYGNYMEIPSLEKRYNHPPKILDFDDGKGNVIKYNL